MGNLQLRQYDGPGCSTNQSQQLEPLPVFRVYSPNCFAVIIHDRPAYCITPLRIENLARDTQVQGDETLPMGLGAMDAEAVLTLTVA